MNMSWPTQNPGQWNPGLAMAPDMNMSSYTPEQWAAMQQQNWQQWTQWQQQYAQWQSQYGEKYTEQMQALQSMGGMPPLPPPTSAPPPAPPPPDKPPPPPHENNQPLYTQKPNPPGPVPSPTNNQNRNAQPANTGVASQVANNSTWPYIQEQSSVSVNAEALKKLAEEERLFDIQFLKWEEEIEKWKKDNVNHPDKQAYKEYEVKFESCRAQLLERRQQMNKKKARLLGTAPPPPPPQSVTSAQMNASTVAPSLHQNVPPPSAPRNTYHNQQQNYGNNSGQTVAQQQPYQNSNLKQPHYGFNTAQNYKQSYDNVSVQMTQQQQSYGNNSIQNSNLKHIPSHGMNIPQNNQNSSDNQYPYQNYTMQNQNLSKGSNNFTNQNKYDVNNDKFPPKDTFTAPPPTNPSFLLASESNKKGIPGLDLVPDNEKTHGTKAVHDVIDITEEKPVGRPLNSGPDYSTISKGINNILGDEKIMNILSMVREQVTSNSVINKTQPSKSISGETSNNLQNKISYEQGYNNQNQQFMNQQYDNRQNNMPYNRQTGNYQLQQNQEPPPHVTNRFIDERQNDSQPDQYNYDRNPQYGHEMGNMYNNVAPPRVPTHGRPNIPVHQNENMYPRGPQQSENQGANDYLRGHAVPPERRPLHDNNINQITPQPTPLPKWIDEPMFTPSIIVEYEHKPLRLKARDFIEPVHMFDYNHKSKDDDNKKTDYTKEVDDLFIRKPRRSEKDNEYGSERYSRDHYYRDFERRAPREELHNESRPRPPFRDDYEDRRRLDEERRRLEEERKRLEDERRRLDNRYDDRRREDRDRYGRREDSYRERDRDFHRDRDRGRDSRREDTRARSRSRDRESRKRGLSKDSDISDSFTKKSRDTIQTTQFEPPKHVVMIDDLLESPGRQMRPEKIVIILRGPPGSGKSYLAKLIRDKEAEHGGTVRIMSIDDYFMQEGEVEEKDPTTGKMIKKPTLKYEYDASSEEIYISNLKRAFKRCLTDGYFSFIIYDAVNESLKSYADVWNMSRQNDFQVYICNMELDPQVCYKRNIHNRTLEDIEAICSQFYKTPAHHIQLDATTLLQSGAITEVQMEDAVDEVIMEDAQEPEVESVFTSKWEKMDDAAQLARLDGTSKPLRSSQLSMEDYLQLDDWKPNTAKPGKKLYAGQTLKKADNRKRCAPSVLW